MNRICTFKHTGIQSLPIEEGTIEFEALRIIALGKTTITKLANELSIGLGQKVSNRFTHQIVRNLRDLNCPIIGDSSGIWIANSCDDIVEFANRLEHKAKSDIASMMTLRKGMLAMASIKAPSLFDNLKLT